MNIKNNFNEFSEYSFATITHKVGPDKNVVKAMEKTVLQLYFWKTFFQVFQIHHLKPEFSWVCRYENYYKIMTLKIFYL